MNRLIFLFLSTLFSLSVYCQNRSDRVIFSKEGKIRFTFPDRFKIPERKLLYFKDHTYTVSGDYQFTDNDSSRIEVKWWVVDTLDSYYHIMALANNGFENERWFLDLKNGRAKGKTKKALWCAPPRTPYGKLIFVHVKASYDDQNENNCYLEFTFKEEKSKCDFLGHPWMDRAKWEESGGLFGRYTEVDGKQVEWGTPRVK